MKQRFKRLIFVLRYNWKNIILFETIYRLIGVAIIFPIGSQLLNLSVRATGAAYITNEAFFDYLVSPITFIIFFIFFVLLAVYVLFEITALSILFHLSEQGQSIQLSTLFITSFKRLKFILKRYHIFILFSTMIFFVLVEGFHIVGIASTIKLPRIIINEFSTFPILRWLMAGLVFLLIILFVETLFFELQAVLTGQSIKESFTTQQSMLEKNRLKILVEFLCINLVLNVILYLFYIIIIGLVSLGSQLFINSGAVFGTLLSLLYIVYLILGFFATILLMPINFAWINVWYYDYNPVTDTSFMNSPPDHNFRFKPSLKRIFITLLVVLAGVNILLVRDSLLNPSSPIQLLNNPRIIAHRGSSVDAPENTVAAIEKAVLDGADAVEVDVRFTKDGVPILMHDKTLKRTTNDSLNRVVSDTTYEEISSLDAGSWFSDAFKNEPVPTLEEALLAARFKVKVYIELKETPDYAAEKITSLLEETNMIYQVKILSFNEPILQSFKEQNNNIKTMLLLSAFLGNLNTLIKYESVDHYGIRYQLIQNNHNYITDLQEAGKEVYVYTINSTNAIQEMDNYGVNGIITDVPIKTREIVYADTTNDVFKQLIQRLFVLN
ncbi:MAG: glycerophosphoryl diester phosphodiesterase membrane domain-containing protein [Candidatus Izimaplasma sp.]|nr:glycerophosphoryl diester phosphodiesterase membrane domain-containing protein [Candidatus Izimaplasma bacterium]